MLHGYCKQFLDYCQLADFSIRSLQALTIRMNEFKAFLKSQRIRSAKKITYQHLIDFGNQGDVPEVHVVFCRKTVKNEDLTLLFCAVVLRAKAI